MDGQLPPEHGPGTPQPGPPDQAPSQGPPAQAPPPWPPAGPPPLMPPDEFSKPRRPGGRRALPLVALGLLIGGIVGSAAGATLVAQRQRSASAGPSFISAPKPSGSVLPAANAVSAAAIYQQDAAGVVTITTELAACV